MKLQSSGARFLDHATYAGFRGVLARHDDVVGFGFSYATGFRFPGAEYPMAIMGSNMQHPA